MLLFFPRGSPWLLLALALCALGWFALPTSVAESPPELKEITIAAGPPYHDVGPGCRAQLLCVERDDKQQLWARGVSAGLDYLQDHFDKAPGMQYPRLKQGDIVPLFGHLFRVSRLIDRWPEFDAKSKDSIELERLADKEIPPDIAVRPDSFVIPLRWQHSGGEAALHETRVDVCSIALSQQGEKKSPVAHIKITEGPDNRKVLGGEATLRRGDILLMGDVGHRVRNVVPRDEERGIIGWLELDSRPLTQAELTKTAAPIIQAEPPLEKKLVIYNQQYKSSDFNKIASLTLTRREPNGTTVFSVAVNPPYLWRRLGGAGLTHYPLTYKDIVPMFGQLYRVRIAGITHMELDWIPDEKAPESLRPALVSLIIPLCNRRSGNSQFIYRTATGQEQRVKLIVLAIAPGKEDEEPTAQITFDDPRNPPSATIRRGDTMEFGHKHWRVRNIVPYQPEQHIIGWVELEQIASPEKSSTNSK
jgi:hypothetical protein